MEGTNAYVGSGGQFDEVGRGGVGVGSLEIESHLNAVFLNASLHSTRVDAKKYFSRGNHYLILASNHVTDCSTAL